MTVEFEIDSKATKLDALQLLFPDDLYVSEPLFNNGSMVLPLYWLEEPYFRIRCDKEVKE